LKEEDKNIGKAALDCSEGYSINKLDRRKETRGWEERETTGLICAQSTRYQHQKTNNKNNKRTNDI
jgi:hypothetical protein